MDVHLVCGLASVYGTVVSVSLMFIETTIQKVLYSGFQYICNTEGKALKPQLLTVYT